MPFTPSRPLSETHPGRVLSGKDFDTEQAKTYTPPSDEDMASISSTGKDKFLEEHTEHLKSKGGKKFGIGSRARRKILPNP